MPFADRLTRSPDPYDAARGADAAQPFGDHPAEIRVLLEGAAGSSPHLCTLIGREADWLNGALEEEPETTLDALLAALPEAPEKGLGDTLRQAKRRVALLAALADLGGLWPLETVTGALTRFADAAVDAAVRAQVGHEIARGKLPDSDEACDRAAGLSVLAMGKMGAFELNYSSDIDLICLFDETLYDEETYLDARSALVRATRNMAAMLSETTGEGYVFRTDLRLRPDPSVTPVCLSMEAAERYYESLGRTWERAAYVKARACAGDVAAGARFLDSLTPFVWRKHLDFWAVRDAHDMRLRIRSHKGLGGPITLPGHDMKLGRGGIREIEFFTQTRQIIAGGREPSLRVRGTVEGLDRLAAAGWIPRDVADTLSDDYRAHREVEHRLQMINDLQTHDLPQDEAGFDRLAALMGRDAQGVKDELAERLERVRGLTEDFFDPGATPEGPDLTEEQAEIVARWRSYPALRSERAQAIFDRLRPELLKRVEQSGRPDRTLTHLDGFLAGLPAGVQLFSLLDANPTLIDLLVDIAGTSPALATYLSRHSGVFDAVIGGSFFDDWPGGEALEEGLTRELRRHAEDYEAQLDAARHWVKEWHFRIGVHHLRGLTEAEEARVQYADLAEAVLRGLFPAVTAEFARRHGAPPGNGASVLGMGSLGAGRLHSASDLDLIVIYDADGVEQSGGRRPLPTRTYYARLTQALVTALSAPMPQGRLYEVDMRLRPSGKQGPVATALSAFRSYQSGEAWTWEHLALTRARPLAGEPGLGAAVEALRCELLGRPREAGEVYADVQAMRERLAEAGRAEAAPLEPKTGRGRMQDIELLAAALALLTGSELRTAPAQIEAGRAAGLIDEETAATLAGTHQLFSAVQAVDRLLTGGGVPDPDGLGAGGEALLLRETGAESVGALVASLRDRAAIAATAIDAVLGAGKEDRDDGTP